MSVLELSLDEISDESDSDELADELSDITSDLVTLKQNNGFLLALFRKEFGKWVDVFETSMHLPQIAQRLGSIQELLEGPLLATWLNYSTDEYNDAYCVILFFAPGLSWSNTLLFNKQTL